MELFLVGLAIILLPVFVIVLMKDAGKKLELEQVWNTLDQHLATQNYNVLSRIEAMTYVGKDAKKILNVAISIDTYHKLLILTKLNEDRTDLISETLAFDQITGGEVLIGGKSTTSSSYGSVIGMNNQLGPINGSALGGSVTTTNVEIGSIEYKIKTRDISNPIFTVVISSRSITESSAEYKHYMDVIVRLDTVIQQIIAGQNR